MYKYSQRLGELISNILKDKILLLSFLIVSILTISHIVNKLFLGVEPVQYSFFSYDKILHLLTSILLVRTIYWLFRQKLFLSENFTTDSKAENRNFQRKIVLKASLIAFILYALIWEPFELFTFVIQDTSQNQLYQEFFDIPLDWIYDAAGVITSYFLGYE